MGSRSISKAGKLLVYYLFGVMFFFSISTTMTGILIPRMTEGYALSYTQVGAIGSVQSIGGLLAILFGGVLSDRFQKLKLIGIIFSLYTLLMYFVGLAPPYLFLLGGFLLIGISNSYLNVLISACISEQYEEKRDYYLNLCHAFYGLGSLAGPIYASVALGGGQVWNQSFLQLGLICTVVVLLFFTVYRQGKGASFQPGEKQPLRALLTDRKLLWICGACLLYMGQQSAMSLWIASFVQEEMHSEAVAGAALTLYWTGVMAGRFLQPVISRKIEPRKWLCATCVVSAVLFAVAFLVRDPAFLVTVLCCCAVLTGSAFPTMIAMGCARHPSQTGAATSLVCLGSSLGGVVFPSLVGILVQSVSFLAGMLVIPVVLVLCSLTLLLCGPEKAGQ